MEVREKYISQILTGPANFGLAGGKFIHSPQVFTARSVRLRCQYLCSQTRQSDTVPPYSPAATETREVLDEYKYGILLRAEEPFGDRPHTEVWKEFAGKILAIEGECMRRGYPRAFAIAVGTCIYQHHDDHLRPCDYDCKSRPTFEALGIELKDTLEMVQWHGFVNREADAPLQLFALLLLE